MEPVEITVVIDQDDSVECMYVEGKAWDGRGEQTIYVTDLFAAAKGRPILLTHKLVDWTGPWPDTLEEIRATGDATA